MLESVDLRFPRLSRQTRYSLLIAFLLFAGLALAVWLRKQAPPEVARLLPESDAILYANLKPLRSATHFDRTPVERSAEYAQFIAATGIVPERDLDAVAFALQRMDDPNGPNGSVAYSEVFEGRFDGDRLRQYLRSIATQVEPYAGHDIFTIPVGEAVEGRRRQLRVVQLGYDTIAASNTPTAEQIHLILDRHRSAALPFSGSSLLAARYGDVPLLSSAWAIGHVGLPFSERGRISVFGLQLPLAEDTTFVASVRYIGSVRLRVEELAPSETEAARTAETLRSLLALVGQFEMARAGVTGGSEDPALREALASVKVEQHKDRAVLTAAVPVELLRQMAGAPTDSTRR